MTPRNGPRRHRLSRIDVRADNGGQDLAVPFVMWRRMRHKLTDSVFFLHSFYAWESFPSNWTSGLCPKMHWQN